MEGIKDIFDAFNHFFDGIGKSFEGFEEAFRDGFFYLVGVPSEASKNKEKPKSGMNIKGYLFIWPFIIAVLIVFYLFARIFI
jgi:hypothetical protein